MFTEMARSTGTVMRQVRQLSYGDSYRGIILREWLKEKRY